MSVRFDNTAKYAFLIQSLDLKFAKSTRWVILQLLDSANIYDTTISIRGSQ